jgi:tetratricopeptide (TPR) repeat protein
MISSDQNIALLTVANSAKENPLWLDYSEYCNYREQGIRKEAFKKLELFINSTKKWTFEQRIDFAKFLLPLFENVKDADYGPFPQPLSEKMIKPTLEEWCKIETVDCRPFRWYGKYYRSEDYLFKALEINPKDDLSRNTLLNWWTYNIYFSIHHLPEGYIGNVEQDLKQIEKIKEFISQINDNKIKQDWLNEIAEDFEIVNNYKQWKDLGHPNLMDWGKENHKQVSYNMTRTYYYTK